MTQFDEFSWLPKDPRDGANEYQAPDAAFGAAENKTVFSESVLKPPKKKRTRKSVWPVAVSCAVISSMLTFTAMTFFTPMITGGGSNVVIYQGVGNPQDGEGAQARQVSMVTDAGKTVYTVEEIAQKVGPAVVGVSCSVSYASFFGTQTGTSSGSGIIINKDGYVVTNYHVIDGAESVKIKLNTGEELSAKLIGGDKKTDIAVVKIEAPGTLTYAVFGDSDAVEVGSLAVAIGNPLGDELFGTVTSGIISGVNRSINVDGKNMTLLQTDAAINSGNSGGPLINKYGEVVGINSVKLVTGTSEGLGFAIPSSTVKQIVGDLISDGYVKGRPLIGITTRELNKDIAYYNNLPVEQGLYVMSVAGGSAAEKAGVKRGDIIVKFDGKEVKTTDEINKLRDAHKAGDTVDVVINRDGQEMSVKLTLGEDRPETGL